MGTVPHHRAKAIDFLWRAERAISEHDPTEAASALCRAASHAATTLAVHYGCKHNSKRRLEFALHVAMADQCLSRSHLKTFRQSYALVAALAARNQPAAATAGRSKPNAGLAINSKADASIALRRLRRRVSSMLSALAAFLNGTPKPVRYHKLYLRKPDRPILPDLTHVRHIITLPNYDEIRNKFNLVGAPVAAEPDPHGAYLRGQPPQRCPCHRDLWNKHEAAAETRFTLSPLWKRALEKTFRTKLPDQLQLTC